MAGPEGGMMRSCEVLAMCIQVERVTTVRVCHRSRRDREGAGSWPFAGLQVRPVIPSRLHPQAHVGAAAAASGVALLCSPALGAGEGRRRVGQPPARVSTHFWFLSVCRTYYIGAAR